MAGTSLRHAAAVANSGQDAPGLLDTLGAPNMHDSEDSLKASHQHNKKDATAMMDTHNTASHDETDAMRAVLDTVSRLAMSSRPYPLLTLCQSELLELILSRLPTKDLTHALTVSKHWQKSILRSVVFRRNFFSIPNPSENTFVSEWKSDTERSVRLTHEPGSWREPNRVILELHPVLRVRLDESGRSLSEGHSGIFSGLCNRQRSSFNRLLGR